MNPNKFNEAKDKLVNKAANYAAKYLLSKYGEAHLIGEPKVELTSTVDPDSSSLLFSGKITVSAAGLLNNVNVDMTVNSNEIEVDSETSVQSKIESAINAQEELEPVKASLDGFKLLDDGTTYLKVSHTSVQDASIGVVGKNEYATSKDRAALLQGMLKDAMLETPVSFTGEFKEPTIQKQARMKDCWECGAEYDDKNKYQDDLCDKCRGAKPKKEAALAEPTIEKAPVIKEAAAIVEARFYPCEYCADGHHTLCKGGTCECASKKCEEKNEGKKEVKKSSWLTADFSSWDETEPPMSGAEFMEYQCPVCKESFEDYDLNQHDKSCPGTPEVMSDKPTIAIQDNMPMARAHDSMSHMAQFEEQSDLEAQLKVEHEASNQLMSLLQGMGYGTAKTVEITSAKDGFDIMTAIDDAGSVKAVSIPVTVKEGKVVLPKKALISTLIAKGLDIQAKLAEQFDLEALEKLAAIDERMAYEANEAEAILAERPVTKEAAGEKQPFFDSDDSTMTVQKHLLPDHDKLKKGDRLNDGTDDWEIVNTEGQQNDKNEGSSSIWTLKKVQGPERDGKEPKNKIPS